MGRRRKYRNFTEAYRELAVRRLKETDNVAELCRELGISRQLLYQWRDRQEREQAQIDPVLVRERQLRQEVGLLKKALAEKTLEVDFFKGALQKIEALRQAGTGSGGTASTRKCGN